MVVGGFERAHPSSQLRRVCRLNFSRFVTDAGADWLRVHNGSLTTDPVVASLSGDLTANVSAGLSVTVSTPLYGCVVLAFTSDYSGVARGVALSYSSIAGSGNGTNGTNSSSGTNSSGTNSSGTNSSGTNSSSGSSASRAAALPHGCGGMRHATD